MRILTCTAALVLTGSLYAQMAFHPSGNGGSSVGRHFDVLDEMQKKALVSDTTEPKTEEESNKGDVILSVLGGTCMPFGKYAAFRTTAINDVTLGFADPGSIVSFNFMVMLAKRFGTSVSLSYFDNPVNVNRYVDFIEPLLQLNSASNYSYNVKTGSWRTNTFMLGLAYKTMNERVSFELNFKTGLMSSRSPEISVLQTDGAGNTTVFFEHKSEQHFSIGAAPGMQFRFRVIKSLYLNLNSELMFGQFYLNKIPFPQDQFSYYDRVIMANFNLLAGLSWEFRQ